MKRFLLPALLLSLPAFAAPPAIVDVRLVGEYDPVNGGLLEVDLAGPGAKYVYAEWSQGSVHTRVYLEGEGQTWSGTLPACSAGSVTVSVEAEDENGNVSDQPWPAQSYPVAENTTSPRGLTPQRYPLMTEWTASSLGTHWTGNGYSRNAAVPQAITLRGTATEETPTATGAGSGGSIRTNLGMEGGLGSLWFKAKMVTGAPQGRLVVEKITYDKISPRTGAPIFNAPTTVAEVTVPAPQGVAEWHQFHLLFQDPAENAAYRIRNKTLAEDANDRDNKAIDVCDIVLTPVIPDVKIWKDELDYAPGYPSIQDPIEFHIAVSNVFPSAPAANFSPILYWRQNAEDQWTPTPMTNLLGRTHTGDGTYACILTPEGNNVSDGPFEYFYEVDFTGYTPTFPARKNKGPLLGNVVNHRFDWYRYPYLIHTNSWGLLMDANENVSENRSPAVYPSFYDTFLKTGRQKFYHYATSPDAVQDSPATNGVWDATRKFDIRNLDEGWPIAKTVYYPWFDDNSTTSGLKKASLTIEDTYDYNAFLAKDGVRRFRSLYTELAAVTKDFSTNLNSHLPRAVAMQHVGDYTWQAIFHITNAVDAYFSVTGAYHSAEGATAYDAGPFEWVQLDQDELRINPPMDGTRSDGSQIDGYEMTGYERTRTIVEQITNVVWSVNTTTATWVGVVTNAVETNELGQALVPPTADDVAYWFTRFEFEELEDGSVQTNTPLQALNFILNVVDPDKPELSTVTTNRYSDFQDYILADGAWYVTNECAVGTSVTRTLVPGATSTRTETYFEYLLDEETLPQHETVRTRVQIDYDGFLMYRFCTTNGSWQIRRAAWQDFNEWQADDKTYSRSFGLYDMKEFPSDLEGRDLTVFAESLNSETLDFNKAMDDYCDGAGTYLYGYIGKNAKIVKDRVLSDNAPDWTSTTKNTEVVLRGYPGLEGSLETTSENKGEGRGTLKMRVRSHSDDDRNITYVPGAGWSNYRVVARIMDPKSDDVSDAEHSLSLIGYWQDPFNYWEARITQHSDLMADQQGRTRNWFEVRLFQWIEGECYEKFGEIKGNNYGGWNGYQASATKWPTFPGRNNTDNNGTKNESGYWNRGNDHDFGLFTLNRTTGDKKPIRWVFVLDLLTDGNTVTPMVWAFRSHDVENGSCANCTLAAAAANTQSGSYFLYKFGPIDCSNGATTSGRPGFNMRDCGLKIAPYVLPVSASVNFKGTGGTDSMNAVATASGGSDKWDRSDRASYDRKRKIDVWQVNPGSHPDSAPTTLTRPAPLVFYGVRTYRTGEEEFPEGQFTAPVPFYQNGITRDWEDDWDTYNGHDGDGVKSVAQWRWKDVSFAMDLWDQTFISVKALSKNGSGTLSKGNLAVDSITCDDWRGVTVWDKDYANPEVSAVSSFQATYAAIAADGRTGRRYELNRSRANPERKQAITTPQLVHGVGDILFTYEVADHPVKVSVQLGDWTGSEWSDLEGSTEILPAGSSGTKYVPCLTNISGRLRIVAEDPAEDCRENGQLGTLYVDNIRATDYPNKGDTSWEVYNALVSTFPADVAQRSNPPLGPLALRKLKFDGATKAAETFRSTVLNDGPDSQTPHGNVFDEHQPFVQTPSIETGVGEVSFWYRASPDNTGPAHLKLMVAKAGSTPDDQWTELGVGDLYWDDEKYDSPEEDAEYMRQKAALEALSNITTPVWTYFSVEFYQKDFRLLRVTGENDGDNRVMLDNMLITEPVRASIDVGAIEFTPDIPLDVSGTDAKITLVNPRMAPSNIRVFLEWYVDTSAARDIPTTNEWIRVLTNREEHTVILPGGIEAYYYTYWYVTNSRPIIDVTRVPANLKWGFEAWSNRWDEGQARWDGGTMHGGSIACTNAPGGSPYVWYTSAQIPTDKFPADSVFQYCVKVLYDGRFKSPVYSELQGRVKNGFWFENPKWYDPIDLNKTFETQERPVGHFWSFSCTTNVVFINELQPVYGENSGAAETGVASLKNQFVEIMGPEGASVANWRLEHFGFDDTGELNPNFIAHTNILSSKAVFQAARNATTNKGWGFWVLGCYGLGDLANEELFPRSWADVETYDDAPFIMSVPGALRLRRSMGAYVDTAAWGSQRRVTDFVNMGFKYLRDTYYDSRSLAWEGSGDTMRWNVTRTKTIGGYNYQEEDVLPFLGGKAVVEEIAGIDPPEFLSIAFKDEYTVTIRVRVRVDAESVEKGLALKAEDYSWCFEATSELGAWEAALPYEIPAAQGLTAPADGSWAEFDVDVPALSPNALFYRLVATPAK